MLKIGDIVDTSKSVFAEDPNNGWKYRVGIIHAILDQPNSFYPYCVEFADGNFYGLRKDEVEKI